MIRVLHISDVHLGARLGGFESAAAERREAIRAAFRRLPDRAEALEVDAVLVAGDLFDATRPAAADVDVAREVLRALAANGRPVVAIPGNHDAAAAADSPWRAMPDVVTTILDPRFGGPRTFALRGGETALHVYGIAFDPAVESDPVGGYRRADAPGMHVLLLHAGVADHPDWTGGASLRTTTAELAGLDADYVALGDYHGFRPPSEFGGAPACYCGSFAAVAIDEVGPRGCAIVDLEPGAPPRVRLEPSPVPALVDLGNLDVSDADDEIDVAERVGAALGDATAHPVATLSGEPAFPLDIDRVRDAVRERYGFAVVRDETRFIDSAHVRALAGQPTIAGHVARLGLERREAAAGEAARAEAERALRLALRALEVETP
jgi:DNA repair exonuclease SbcCD nuclease subunit